jgi:hypothetical protein
LRCDAQGGGNGWDQAQRIARKPQMASATGPPRLHREDHLRVDNRGAPLAHGYDVTVGRPTFCNRWHRLLDSPPLMRGRSLLGSRN